MRLAAKIVLASWFVAIQAAGEEPAGLPPKEKFHVWLLMGQSNMAGRGEMTEMDRRHVPGVFTLNKENRWVPAAHPLHWDKPKVVGVGLGMSFAEAMREEDPSLAIGLIPCAFGGSPLVRSSKGGDLYANAVARARVAAERGVIKGVLWHQGETDSDKADTANTYAQRLARMIADLRADLSQPALPVVAGGLCTPFLANPKYAFAPTVQKALEDLPRHVPNTAFASSAGLVDKGDKVHFSAAALREFGRRYAVEMRRLEK